jgi:antitoxin ParD1/3/4
MSTGITPENEQFVVEIVQAGTYKSRDAVIDDAITLLRQREDVRRKVNAGIEQAERGELLDGDMVFDRLEDRARKIVASAGDKPA